MVGLITGLIGFLIFMTVWTATGLSEMWLDDPSGRSHHRDASLQPSPERRLQPWDY